MKRISRIFVVLSFCCAGTTVYGADLKTACKQNIEICTNAIQANLQALNQQFKKQYSVAVKFIEKINNSNNGSSSNIHTINHNTIRQPAQQNNNQTKAPSFKPT